MKSFLILKCLTLQYNRTIEAVFAVEHAVDMLLDLLQIYREKAGDKMADKGGSIFTKACFLLILLVQDRHRAAVRGARYHKYYISLVCCLCTLKLVIPVKPTCTYKPIPYKNQLVELC